MQCRVFRIFAVLVALVSSFCLAACQSSGGEETEGGSGSERRVKKASKSGGSSGSDTAGDLTSESQPLTVTLRNKQSFQGSVPNQVLTDTLVSMEELVRKRPKDINVLVTYLGLLRLHGQGGQIYESVLRKAGSVGAKNPWFLLEAGFGALVKNNFALAEYLFSKAEKLAKGRKGVTGAVRHAFGLSHLLQGQVQQAVFEMKKAAAGSEPHLPSVLTLGYMALRYGDYKGAERNFRTAMALAADNLNSRVGLAATLRATGKAQDALPLLKGVYSKNSKDRRVAWNYALTLSEVSGREKEAIGILDKYFQLPGSFPEIDARATELLNKLQAKGRS